MPPAPQKISLATDLQSRDGTLNYDGLITNGYVEKVGDGFRVYKRTGLTHLYSLGAATAKGMTNYIDGSGNENLLVLNGSSLILPNSTSLPTAASANSWTSTTAPLGATVNDTTYFSFGGKLWALSHNHSGNTTDVYYQTAAAGSWTLAGSDVTGGLNREYGCIFQMNGAVFWIPETSSLNVTEVWRSYDAIHWTRLTTSPGWATNQNPHCEVLNGVAYFLGGTQFGVGAENKVWSSTDGTTWTSVNASPAYGSGRSQFSSCAGAGRLWVMGGIISGTYKQDVWYSTDGNTWTQATATAGWSIRANASVSVMGYTLVLIGGQPSTGATSGLQDSWTSTDGITWTQQQTSLLANTFWGGALDGSQSFMFGDVLIVTAYKTGGSQTSPYAYVTPTGSGTVTISSSVGITPTGFADFATNYTRNQVMVRCDSAAYKFNPIGMTLTQITSANYPVQTVRGCVYLDGTFYVMDKNGTIFGSAIDDCTTWSALNFISAEADPDQGVFLAKKDAYVVGMGSQTIQYFWDAANATGSPLSAVQSGVINIGCAHGFSVQQMESSVIFMGQRKAVGTSFQKGRFIAMLTDGLNYKVISTPDVDRVLNADDLATIYSCVSAENGHNFYHLLLGTSGITLTYDLTTGIWGNWTRSTAGAAKSVSSLTQSNGTATVTATTHGFSDGDEVTIAGASPSGYNLTINITYVDANTFTYPVSSSLTTPATGTITATGSTESYFDMVASCSYSGTQVFQGISDGFIWQILDTNMQDNSVTINFKARTAKRDYGNIYWKFPYMLTYMGNVPNVATDAGLLRYTDDDYVTYSNYRVFDLTDVYSNLHRFGKYRRRAWEWRHTAAQKHYIDFLQEDVSQGSV